MASVDQLLADARRGLKRLTPVQAAAAVQHGALLIDTRPSEQRRRDGEVPGAIVIERNFLEWRLDPTSPDRIPQLSDRESESLVIIMCNEAIPRASLRRHCSSWVCDTSRTSLVGFRTGLPAASQSAT